MLKQTVFVLPLLAAIYGSHLTLASNSSCCHVIENPEGEYALLISDARGAQRFGVGTIRHGFVGLIVRDGHGIIRSNLYANDDSSDPSLQTCDADGHARTKLGLLGGYPLSFVGHVIDEQGLWLRQAPRERRSVLP